MQFIPFCLFTIICGYSLVISAPVNQTTSDTEEVKHQKATVIANRLLKELAGEQLASHHEEQSLNNDENKNIVVPVNHPETPQIESNVDQQNDDDDNNNNEDIEFVPTIEDLYRIYGDRYAQLVDDDEESSSEMNDDDDDDYILPINNQQLMQYLEEELENNKHLTPVIHTPVMDDSIMKAENHQRRRRSFH